MDTRTDPARWRVEALVSPGSPWGGLLDVREVDPRGRGEWERRASFAIED